MPGDRNDTKDELPRAIDAAKRFSNARFPGASLTMLCGSWARGCAHPESDLDLIVVDSGLNDEVLFEGALFESWIVEVCALPPHRVEAFFRGSAEYRNCPIPKQALDGIVVIGDAAAAKEIQAIAREVVERGPQPLSEKEALDLRWNLTVLLTDLARLADGEVLAVAAQCHTQLAQAVIDGARGWRGERKALRRALLEIAPAIAAELDDGLRAACRGDRGPLLRTGQRILESLGGSQRTYVERY
jgi:hypothetical protein